jgi:hypothetical protein
VQLEHVRLTAVTREPKSVRLGSTPESTTAIAGALGAGVPSAPLHSGATPAAWGQRKPDWTL